jgi:hypothetical protein
LAFNFKKNIGPNLVGYLFHGRLKIILLKFPLG